tara:strand:- start:27 stop:299 length:273 start_codon:yes stop_codon:yes gene_type:complete
METIIIISVLSTLGVVALVTAIVVMFIKLKKKVDIRNLTDQLNDIHNSMRNMIESINQKESEIYNTIQKAESLIDSRCDKLHNEIKSLIK